MDVSERKDKLQRHRCKRQPTPTPLSGPSATQNASTPAYDSLQRSRSRANMLKSKILLAGINCLDCCANVTARGWPTVRTVASITSEPCILLLRHRRSDLRDRYTGSSPLVFALM